MSIFRQNMRATMELSNMEVKKIEKEDKVYVVLKATGNLVPNGMRFQVDKLISIKNDTHPFLIEKIEEYKGFVAEFEKRKAEDKKSYGYVNVKPKLDKKGNVDNQYDKVKTEFSDDGRAFHKIDGWLTLLDSREQKIEGTEDSETYISYPTRDGSFEKKLSEIESVSIEACMYLMSDDQQGGLLFTSGGDYPVELFVNMSEEMANSGSPKIGQAYKLLLTPTKGQLMQAAKQDDSLIGGFDDDAENVKTSKWDTDKLMLAGVGKIKGEMLDGLDEGESGDILSDILA